MHEISAHYILRRETGGGVLSSHLTDNGVTVIRSMVCFWLPSLHKDAQVPKALSQKRELFPQKNLFYSYAMLTSSEGNSFIACTLLPLSPINRLPVLKHSCKILLFNCPYILLRSAEASPSSLKINQNWMLIRMSKGWSSTFIAFLYKKKASALF